MSKNRKLTTQWFTNWRTMFPPEGFSAHYFNLFPSLEFCYDSVGYPDWIDDTNPYKSFDIEFKFLMIKIQVVFYWRKIVCVKN